MEEPTDNTKLTDEELELMNELGIGPANKQEDKGNAYSFFKKILYLKDTLRASNLSETELGVATFPVRTSRELALFCDTMDMKLFAEYFKAESEIITSSALSRKGFLIRQSVTTKKESAIGNLPEPTKKKGLFSFSNKQEEVD